LNLKETGRSLVNSDNPEDSVSMSFLNLWLELVQSVPELAFISLVVGFMHTDFSPAPAVAVKPSNPTVPVTLKVRQGEVVPMPTEPPCCITSASDPPLIKKLL